MRKNDSMSMRHAAGDQSSMIFGSSKDPPLVRNKMSITSKSGPPDKSGSRNTVGNNEVFVLSDSFPVG